MRVFTGHPGAFWLFGREIRPVSELRGTHTQETREGERWLSAISGRDAPSGEYVLFRGRAIHV
jgi:uncharacterized protein with LGFP repeats